MLEDTPRKLLRIIVQFRYHFKRMPTLPELRRLSGRRPADIIKGFKILAAENYIAWESSKPVETAVILEGWERGVPYDSSPQRDIQSGRGGTNIDYWLYH
ncbi:hypothetical protein [Paenibacillus graminis]|uniref:hypothetical protein n=1 Tax=Paenibacillus graminis TaxID=189425 RepID=UPI002DBD2ABC|nr:hypothetical protein [Paenibacillus graminis]MEC0167347.1 hypothetical protein [Paenibacillus graminis]